MGSNPASEPKTAEADPGPCRELPGAEPYARFGPGASPRMPWKTVRRCPSGMSRPACRTCVPASPCPNGEGPFAGKSTGRKRPIVSGRFRTCQKVSGLSDTAANGLVISPWSHWSTSPHPMSRHTAATPSHVGTQSVPPAWGSIGGLAARTAIQWSHKKHNIAAFWICARPTMAPLRNH